RLIEVLLPKGPLGAASPLARRAFLRDGRYEPGVRLSREEAGATRLRADELKATDWLPGTVKAVYDLRGDDAALEVAIKEHVASRAAVHPRLVEVSERAASIPTHPLLRFPLEVEASGGEATVRDAERAKLDFAPVERY